MASLIVTCAEIIMIIICTTQSLEVILHQFKSIADFQIDLQPLREYVSRSRIQCNSQCIQTEGCMSVGYHPASRQCRHVTAGAVDTGPVHHQEEVGWIFYGSAGHITSIVYLQGTCLLFTGGEGV